MVQKNIAIRKRAQIAAANRMMFMWVVGVSVVFGFAVVGIIFLAQILVFNEKVLAEKNRTVKNLDASILVVPKLETNVKKLDANQALIDSKSKSDDQAIQAIIDALPSDSNSLALGASFQNKLLANISGLVINSLQIESVDGRASSIVGEINFNFSVSGDDNALRQVLTNLELSIRTIDITAININSQGGSRIMSVKGRAFYEPAIKVELKEKIIKQ